MEYLAKKHGLWMEGACSRLRLVTPPPIVLPFGLSGYANGNVYAFCEDYFDSATRVRRGRLYQSAGRNGDRFEEVSFFPYPSPSNGCPIDEIYETARLTVKAGQEVILGDNLAQTYWTVVLAERRGLDAYYITLKSKTFLGVLPELLSDTIPEKSREDIQRALDAVVEAAPIQAPQPVIDACRVAATHILLAMYPQITKNELGQIVGKLDNGSCIQSATNLINKLHTRAKPSGPANNDTRLVSQRDADLAVSAIAFLLQDFGWVERAL